LWQINLDFGIEVNVQISQIQLATKFSVGSIIAYDVYYTVSYPESYIWGVFKKRPDFLNSAPTSKESELRFLGRLRDAVRRKEAWVVGKPELDVTPWHCTGSRVAPRRQLSGKTWHPLCPIHPILWT